MEDKGIRPGVWMAVAGGLALLGLVVFLLQSRRGAAPAESPKASQEQAVSTRPAPPVAPSRR
jgi:hypothetical protein